MMMEDFLSENVKVIKPSGIRKFFDLASQMEGVISLGVGEPNFETPWLISEAAIHSIKAGKTFYTANKGLITLRKEICKYQKRRFDIDYNAEKNVLVTVGGSEAIDLALRAVINPGDEVLIPSPAYVAYEPCVQMANGVVKFIPLKEENQFKLTPELLEEAISEKTKVLLINFPSNPTGGIMTKEDYEKIVPLIKKHNLIVISDEIYGELTYERQHYSLAHFDEIKDQVILISGFSKAYAMTGWRLGYVLAHEVFIKAMTKIHQFIIMSAPTAPQFGAIEGLRNGDERVVEMRESYMARRNFVVNGFNRIGLKTHLPEGAFYVFPNISSTGLTSEQFCEALLQDQLVACVPGNAFGEAGEGFIRVSYASDLNSIKIAIDRIEIFLNKLKNGEIKVK